MAKKIKSRDLFYDDVTKRIKKGMPLKDVMEFSKQYDIPEEDVTVWINKETARQATDNAITNAKSTMKAAYITLDTEFLEDHPHMIVKLRGENREFYEYQESGVYKYYPDIIMKSIADQYFVDKKLIEERTSQKKISDFIERISNSLIRKGRVKTDAIVTGKQSIGRQYSS